MSKYKKNETIHYVKPTVQLLLKKRFPKGEKKEWKIFITCVNSLSENIWLCSGTQKINAFDLMQPLSIL